MNILLVDDNIVERTGMAMLLEDRGHHVVHAGDGEEALQLLAAATFDVMLFDLSMPKINGLQLVTLANERGILHCPAIAITGQSPAWTEDSGGVIAATLEKPVEVEEVVKAICNAIEKK